MSIASYADLLSAVQDYEDDSSSVVTTRLADMVTLAEQRIFYGGTFGSDYYTQPLRCRAIEREITFPIGPGVVGGTSGGTANAQTVALSPAPTLTLGTSITFKAGYTNTGATTLNAESTGSVDMRKGASRDALEAGDILAGGIYTVYHDGTYWVLIPSDGASPLPANFLGVKSAYLQDRGVILTPQTNSGVNTFMDGATSGTPEYYTIQGDSIRLEPLPQSTDTVKMTYYRKPSALSVSLNDVFRQAPAIYLYATLFELALYLPNDATAAKWFALFRNALDGYMGADVRASMSYAAGRSRIRGENP